MKNIIDFFKIDEGRLSAVNFNNMILVKVNNYKLLDLYNKGKLSNNIKERCCNFKLLEEKCAQYDK